MSRKQQPLVVLALIAIVTLISACGSGASGDPGNGSGGGNNSTANHEQAVKFAHCMRQNGVTAFPDPDPDASGGLTIDGVVNGSSMDPNTPAFKNALGACKDLEPPGFMGQKRNAQQQKGALKFAQCMRDDGVKDFPDPTPGGPIIDVNGAHSIPGFQAAVQKCRGILAAALGRQQ